MRKILESLHARRRSRAAAWRKWNRTIAVLRDPHFELDLESFGTIVTAYGRLIRAGVQPDRGLRALLHCLCRMALYQDDSDTEHDVDGSAREDDHSDFEPEPFEGESASEDAFKGVDAGVVVKGSTVVIKCAPVSVIPRAE